MKSLIEKVGRVCKFDSTKDYKQVESGLSVDLSDALQTGVVKDGLATLDSNGIEDPDAILGRCRDKFDAIEASRAIRKYGKKASIPETAVTPSVSPQASE